MRVGYTYIIFRLALLYIHVHLCHFNTQNKSIVISLTLFVPVGDTRQIRVVISTNTLYCHVFTEYISSRFFLKLRSNDESPEYSMHIHVYYNVKDI